MLAKGRGKASVEDTAASEDANIGVTHPALKDGPFITKKTEIAPDTGGTDKFLPRVFPGTVLNERRKIPGYGTANYPGANPYNPYQNIKGRINRKGGGIAKRGTGAAYKKGGRVKSMGIAKRGGGVAKR